MTSSEPQAIPIGPQALAQVLAITPYKGGEASIPGVAAPIKLSSNENPLGSSPAAIAAYQAAAARLAIYPDGAAADLRSALAMRHGLEAERIVCGAGSDEIFQLLARAYLAPGDEIVQSAHAFLVYRLVAQAAGALTLSAPESALRADVDAMLALIGPRTKMVFLANPNNPTGTYLDNASLERLIEALPAEVLLVLDEAYAEYADAPDYSSGLELARDRPNLLVTRTFSKIYGLAGLRLGWAYAPASVADALNRVRGPFNVNAPAMAAGIAALADEAFVEQSREHNHRERARLFQAIAGLGFGLAPSQGNFLLVDFGGSEQAAKADAHFRAAGLIFRAMGAYGLPGHLRISIGSVAADDAVIAAFARLKRA